MKKLSLITMMVLLKQKSIFKTAVFLMLLLSIGACKKDEQSTPIGIDLSKSALVKGIVKAELDLTNEEMEFAPRVTKILFQIDANQFTNQPSFSNNFLIYETEVDGVVGYQISIPVNEEGVNFTLIPQDFEYKQLYYLIDPYTGDTTTKNRRVVYKQNSIDLQAIKDEIKIIDFNFTY
ncbi:MAG: hypothetical protein GX103_15490 [Bacteroidales bacterium]|nr:hypothetical protein [Bacteroidales bacterium]